MRPKPTTSPRAGATRSAFLTAVVLLTHLSRVDAIEVDPLHASLAEVELRRKGLESRVRVIAGDSRKILPGLTGPYDIVFVDGGQREELRSLLEAASRGGRSADRQRAAGRRGRGHRGGFEGKWPVRGQEFYAARGSS